MADYSSVVSSGQSAASSAQSAASSAQSSVNGAIVSGQEIADTASSIADAVQSCFGISLSFSMNLFTGDTMGFIPLIDIPAFLENNPILKSIFEGLKSIFSQIMAIYAAVTGYINNIIGLIIEQYNRLMAWIETKKQDILKNPCVKTVLAESGTTVPATPTIGSLV